MSINNPSFDLQILGMGSKRLLTLTHRAQVKRFTQDLLKLLKSQASKQVVVREFSQAYHWWVDENFLKKRKQIFLNTFSKHSFGKFIKLSCQALFVILILFPWLKSRCFSKDWEVTEYGVCELIDIVSEIPDTTICLSQQDNEMVICIPKRGMLTRRKRPI